MKQKFNHIIFILNYQLFLDLTTAPATLSFDELSLSLFSREKLESTDFSYFPINKMALFTFFFLCSHFVF